MDFSPVTNRVATGGGIAGLEGLEALARAGIETVIDCRAEFMDAGLLVGSARHAGLEYLHLPVSDDGLPKRVEWFEEGIAFALVALAVPRRRVIALCAHGINRGPSMAYAILRAQGLSRTLSERMIRKARPRVGLRYRDDADRAIHVLGYD